MGMEHRKQYRVKTDQDDIVQVDLISDKGKTVPAELVDINIGGMGLLVSKESGLDLSVGQQVEISLKFSGKDQPVALTAVVKNQADEGEDRRYGFSFVDAEANRIATSAELFNLFNRRRKQRIEPGHAGPVELVISGNTPVWHD
jgi:c-di-GMP-binding flagellar brake protein YcgR